MQPESPRNISLLPGFCQQLPATLDLVSKYIEICFQNSTEFENVLLDELLKEQEDINFSVLAMIVCFYGLMIVLGVVENSLVVAVIIKNKFFKSPRNMLILNLAISDLILCSITQPFNLVRFLTSHKDWSYGSFTCKFSAIFSGTNIFVSTISITVIALDRFQLIIHPTKNKLQEVATFKAMLLMWLVSVVLASPMVYFTTIEYLPKPGSKQLSKRCTEYDPQLYMRQIKLAYSILSVMIQYLAPLLILITVYTRIYFKVKRRMINRSFVNRKPDSNANQEDPSSRILMNVQKRKLELEMRRQRRTNIILVFIGVIFALSWLPINIVNLIMDVLLVQPSQKPSKRTNVISNLNMKIIQAVSLIVVLCSACSNPLFYSWLNPNFKQEFRKILCCEKKCRITNQCFSMSGRVCDGACSKKTVVVLNGEKNVEERFDEIVAEK